MLECVSSSSPIRFSFPVRILLRTESNAGCGATTVADYLISEFYLAQHPRLPCSDALDILGDELSVDYDNRQRFIREADLAGDPWHPNTLRGND